MSDFNRKLLEKRSKMGGVFIESWRFILQRLNAFLLVGRLPHSAQGLVPSPPPWLRFSQKLLSTLRGHGEFNSHRDQ